jgi:hypothetical protein
LTHAPARWPAKGWTADETAALDASIKALEGDKTLLENAKGASLGSTGARNTSADDLYERLQAIQNAANLEWPERDPANAEIRADFRFGKFPPRGSASSEPAPEPPTPPAQVKA